MTARVDALDISTTSGFQKVESVAARDVPEAVQAAQSVVEFRVGAVSRL